MSAEVYEGSALGPVQKAVYEALSASAALAAVLGGSGKVFDEVEECSELPYVQIGEITSTPYRTHTRKGEEVTVHLHAWSDYKGNKQIADIIHAVNGVLGDAPLVVPGYDVIRCFFEFSHMLREGTDRHGVVRYRIIAQEAA